MLQQTKATSSATSGFRSISFTPSLNWQYPGAQLRIQVQIKQQSSIRHLIAHIKQMLSESFQAINNSKPNEKVSINQMQDRTCTCQICLTPQTLQNCFSMGCQHLFCRSCLVSHITQQISNYQLITCCHHLCNHVIDYSEKSVYHVLQPKTQKIVDSILSNFRRISMLKTCSACKKGVLTQSIFQDKAVLICNQCSTLFCYNCFKPHHSPIISCLSSQKIDLPSDCQQCQKCHSIIQKQLGCPHMKCICGYEFCFECGFHWDHTHICQHKLTKRTGISNLCCNLAKLLFAVPLLLFVGLFVVVAVLALCILSSMLSGVVFWQYIAKHYLFKKNGKVIPTATGEISQQNSKGSENNFLKCMLTILWILMLPVCVVVVGAIGFILPLVNLCHDKQYVLKPSIIKDLVVEVQGWIYLFTIM